MAAERGIRLRRESYGFAIGSAFFAVGALPPYAEAVGPVINNVTFFIGAIFFTLAAFIQLALSGRRSPRSTSGVGDRADWWSAVIQFVGTLFFNLSTTAALLTATADNTRVGDGWRPDAFGSLFFLVSSGLAVLATTRRDRLWDPRARVWRCTWLNTAGSVFFGLSAIGAYVLPATGDLVSLAWANLGTFLGALCFLGAALLSERGIPRGVTPAPA